MVLVLVSLLVAAAPVSLPKFTEDRLVEDPGKALGVDARLLLEELTARTRTSPLGRFGVLIVKDRGNEPLPQLADRAFGAWPIGGGENADAVLLVVVWKQRETRVLMGGRFQKPEILAADAQVAEYVKETLASGNVERATVLAAQLIAALLTDVRDEDAGIDVADAGALFRAVASPPAPRLAASPTAVQPPPPEPIGGWGVRFLVGAAAVGVAFYLRRLFKDLR